jgi:uncharacterized protein (TIGR00369 family)
MSDTTVDRPANPAWRIPFARHLGLEVVRAFAGQSELAFKPRPEHLNSMGAVHGGACMTLLDVAMAHAAGSTAMHANVVTIEMKTSFMQASKGLLTATGRVIRSTGSLSFVEASLVDARGEVCAHATGTFKHLGTRAVPAAEHAMDERDNQV